MVIESITLSIPSIPLKSFASTGHQGPCLNSTVASIELRAFVTDLPPLVVTGVGHMQDVAVVEAEPSAGQPVVLVRVVLEQRPHVESSLGAGPHQRPRHVLLQLVELGLVSVVLLRLVLDTEHHHTPRSFQGLAES